MQIYDKCMGITLFQKKINGIKPYCAPKKQLPKERKTGMQGAAK